MNPVSQFKSVSVQYVGNQSFTLKEISFCVQPGERVALFGCNGSGKTTLLLAAVGLVPFSGEILIDGIPVEKKTLQEVRNRVGFLFNIPEDQILFPKVIDDVAYGLIRRGTPVKKSHEKAAAVLDQLGIKELSDCSPFQLSHGQRQRVALAGALVSAPSVVLLDEPSSALDPRGKLSLARTLRSIQSSILLATHDVEFAEKTCNRYLILHEGQLIEVSSCKDAFDLLVGKSSDI